MILAVLFLLIQIVLGWNQSDLFQVFAKKLNQTQFKDYLFIKSRIVTTDYLIIFGGRGYNNTTSTPNITVYNNLYKINLATSAVTELGLNGSRPLARYNLCGTIVRDRLLIYGGILQNGLLSNQLWQYQILYDRWSLRGTSQMLRKCAFMIMTAVYQNDTAAVMGLRQINRTVSIFEYNIFKKNILTNIMITYFNSLSMDSIMWDDSVVKTHLRLQNFRDLMGNFSIEAKSQVHMPIKYFCLNRQGLNNYSALTNNGIYFVSRFDTMYKVGFSSPRNMQEIDRLDCLNTDKWMFSIYSLNTQTHILPGDIYVEYFHLPSATEGVIHRQKKSLYVDWIVPVDYYNPWIDVGTIFIVNQNMEVFYLIESCGNFTTVNPNVLKCTYGMYSCKQGWTGKNCNVPQCGGSIRTYDKNLLAQIDTQCSNNGQCTATGCLCKKNWTGDNCQIYKNKNCKGSLNQNFIQSNCECNQITTGGNECTVVFCYNDCSAHGQCQWDGKCKCDQGYKGPDCSILEINFDRIG